MAHIISITDFDTPELDVYARLTENQLVNRADPANALFIAESPLVIGRALESGCVPVSFLMEPRHLTSQALPLLERCPEDIPVYTAAPEVLTRLTGFHLTRGMLCAMRRPALPTVEEVCANARRIAVLAVSGNHDSAERLDYAAGLLANQNVYIAGQFRGAPRQIVLNDRFGPVEFTLLPFVRAATVRHYMPEADLPDYDSAVAAALSACAPSAERRVLVAHQMVVAGLCPPQLSGSETAPRTVGTVDSVDAAHFAGFSYTALGHIHRAQRVGSDTVRYAGAPLCYHLDECGMEKSATLVRLGRRGVDGIDTLPLHPRRAMRHIVGPLAKLVEHPADTGDYIWATLTDPTPQPDAMAMLRTAYPNAMRLDYRPQGAEILPADTAQSVRGKPFASLFEDFFTQMNGRPLTVEEARAVKALREEASK